MRSAIEALKEVLSVNQPMVFKILGDSLLELDEKVMALEGKKQDKTEVASVEIPAAALDRRRLQQRLWKLLFMAGTKEDEIAKKIHVFLTSLG